MKNVNIQSLLKNLDSNQLRELRKQFNDQVSTNMVQLEEKERIELQVFIDGLNLEYSYGGFKTLDVVSLHEYGLDRDDRISLHRCSEKISQGFEDLTKLKREVARNAKRQGNAFSNVFRTSVKRMSRYKETH